MATKDQCNYETTNWSTIFTWAGRLILITTAAILGYAFTEIKEIRQIATDNKENIAVIQGNRFTNKDGQSHLVAITENKQAVLAIKDDICEIKDQNKEILRLLNEYTKNKSTP